MATVNITTKGTLVWIVSATCLALKSSWKFADEEKARRVEQIVQEWWCARYPKYGMVNSINLNIDDGGEYEEKELVWCASSECDFARKINPI